MKVLDKVKGYGTGALVFAGLMVGAELVALLFGLGALLVLNLCLAVGWSVKAKRSRR